MDQAKQELLKVLQETRVLLALTDNDFSWSRWVDAEEALTEFDQMVANIASDRFSDLSKLSNLYGPTAAIQEVSLSSGWGREFLDVAAKFDSALAGYQRETRI